MPAIEPKMRVVVLISGSGSNLQAIIDAAQADALNISIAAVISNRPNVKGLQRAIDAGIPTQVVDHTAFASRNDFDAALQQAIDSYQPQLLVLAGFMRILTPGFVRHYLGHMLNIHPSLLPKYPGLNTHQRAIDEGDHEHGASIHFVTEELDGGPVIIQGKVSIEGGESAEQLAQKVLQKEHLIYPQAIQWFATKRLQLKDNHAILDGEILTSPRLHGRQI